MKVTFLGPAWPYRGGIATIIETLARVFGAGWVSGDGVRVQPSEVELLTFRVQYPRILFPGKSQFRDGDAPKGIDIKRVINTVNPLNWLCVGRRLGRTKPDLVVLKYWTPFMAPCFGAIARVARRVAARRGHSIKFVVQLDNVVPHERHWWDTPLTRFFVRSMDGFVAMSSSVERDLAEFLTLNDKPESTSALPDKRRFLLSRRRRSDNKPVVLSPHPMFDHFGEKLPREEACAQLGLDPEKRYAMFFGLVREYKGLDLLLDAWDSSPDRELLVVGEFYDSFERYDLVRDGVTVHPHFVPDEDVKLWFSVADVLILPYKSATQSGVTQIAYHFDVPMIVTDVGGLPEIVRNGTVGFVVKPAVADLRATVEKAFTQNTLESLRANFAVEKQRFSWSAAADAILTAAGQVKI